MRWPVSISVILILAGAALLFYAARWPIYTEPYAPDHLSERLTPTEGMKEADEHVRVDEWFSQLQTYETPYKRLSDMGRGLCAAGLGMLIGTGIWALYHRKAWMQTVWAVFLLWLLLWAARFPLSIWYYQVRQTRFDYPVWADSIAIGILNEWIMWTAGALISSLVLAALLKGYRFSSEIRLRRPTPIYEWFRAILLASWIGLLALCLVYAIPDGDEGTVLTSIVATVVLVIFLTADHAGSRDRQSKHA